MTDFSYFLLRLLISMTMSRPVNPGQADR